jgi:hypothetical protein
VEKKQPKYVRYFYRLEKIVKENTRPIGENSPNLVTLPAIDMCA